MSAGKLRGVTHFYCYGMIPIYYNRRGEFLPVVYSRFEVECSPVHQVI